MKKIVLFLLCALLLLNSFIIIASAHSGKTDSNGGHYDSSTGSYHYHHGYPAHSHAGGVCPYSYDDKTNHGSSSSSSSNKSSSSKNSSSKTTYDKTDKPSEEQNGNGIVGLLIAIAVLGCIAYFSDKKEKTTDSPVWKYVSTFSWLLIIILGFVFCVYLTT